MKNKPAWITALTVALKPAVAATLSMGALMLAAAPATAADVGVSVQISQPGVYGRIDIGRFPQPQVVVAQPVIIVRPVAVVAPPQPMYLWVPPGHRKNWRKHCGDYGACGVPVYFVQDQWYDDHVRYEGKGKGQHKDKDRDGDKGHGKGHGKNKD
ncbi:MAG: hypothetical protein LH480_14725 [Rubrivivax sp.]|nr:hypothetical protein [Rubrivivax sp.]